MGKQRCPDQWDLLESHSCQISELRLTERLSQKLKWSVSQGHFWSLYSHKPQMYMHLYSQSYTKGEKLKYMKIWNGKTVFSLQGLWIFYWKVLSGCFLHVNKLSKWKSLLFCVNSLKNIHYLEWHNFSFTFGYYSVGKQTNYQQQKYRIIPPHTR